MEFWDWPTDHQMGKEDAIGIARNQLNYKLQLPPGHFGLQ